MRLHRRRGFTLIELALALGILLILAAVIIPAFRRLQFRSRRAEVQSNLRAIYDAERSFFQEADSYSGSILKIGFRPDRGNRYTYCLDGCDTTGAQRTDETEKPAGSTTAVSCDVWKVGPAPACLPGADDAVVVPGPNGRFLATATGNLDGDLEADMWSVSSHPRAAGGLAGTPSTTTCPSGHAPAGETCLELDDL